jgi:oligoendopeptidase F
MSHERRYPQTSWHLDDLLPSHDADTISQAIQELDECAFDIESKRDLLTPEIDESTFLAILAQIKQVRTLSARLGAYGALWFASDTQSADALNFQTKINEQLTDLENRLLFFSLWWKDLEDEVAHRLLAASGDDTYYLQTLRRFKPHTLSEAEEKVINTKDVNGIQALTTIYSMITNGFTYHLEIDGEVQELTRAELSMYVQSPDPTLRAGAYQELYRVFGENSKVLAQIYNHVVRDWRSENVTLRHFTSPIAVRNLANDIPNTTVDTLLHVCQQNIDVFQRYFAWKAERLGMDKLRRYDIYAPVSKADKTYPFEDASELVLDTLNEFSPTLGQHAQRVFADGHLDAEIRKGKASGAFCLSALPQLTPWVLLNYTGKASDVATMAHELGHAVHAQMSREHSILTFHSTLPLAETASVFSEQLLTDRLLQHESDPDVRRDLLVNSLDDAYATVMRQAFFVLFEKAAHDMIAAGASNAELNAAYMKNLRSQFEDAVELSPEFQWEWISIPHIYEVPFYCYAYSFGQLLVLSLYSRYKAEGKSFIPQYLRILSHGGSKSPKFILTEAGIDIASSAFWQGGFDVIRDMVDELEDLV